MNHPLNILVVEDEYITQKTLTVLLTEMGYNVVGTSMNAQEAITVLSENKVEFALLDITIQGDKDGIWLANYIQEKYSIPHVFLTAYSDDVTVKNAIATNPYGYLIKPFQKAELFTAIEIAMLNYNKQNVTIPKESAFIYIKYNEIFEKVAIENIIYAESQKNYLLIGTEEKEYRYRSTITEFMDKLPGNFIKTHKGFIVNKTKIDGYNISFITIGSKKIPISKTYKDYVISELNSSQS
ncbi:MULTISPECIES: LytR/AlgR family response regulator transcription factor [Flavobacterium]|uniref:LytR/AlgR family response regulator transcription factor n=1 Tax=Flavobacterium TaxID=237 RepID=UPI001FCBF2D2|nr:MULTISPECIES: response regulator [Flavobacterium]UOK41872.1 response regulator [Flavobacterium enshiense]